jgi:glucan biosynthesis protein C
VERGARSRLHYLDALRVFAMALVVPWHAGIFFAVRGQGGIALAGALWFSHAFRMPLFFLLAGFLGAAVVHRHGERHWVRKRAVRLGIPLVIGVVALAPLAGLLAVWVGEAGQSGYPSLAGFTHPRPDHLWFLWYLLIISAACVAVRSASGRLGGWPRANRLLRRHGDSARAIALLSVPCALVLWSTGHWEADPPNTFMAPAGLLAYYAIFFAVGWLLGDRATGLEALGAHPQRRLTTAVVVAVPAFWLFAHAGDPDIAGNPEVRLAALYLGAICCWCLLVGLVGFCRRHLAEERPSLRYAADASYWIYLSHMLFLAPLQLLLIGLLPGPAQFVLAVTATFALALLTYELIVRYSAIGRVLHGPRRRHGPERAGRSLPVRITPPGAAAAPPA